MVTDYGVRPLVEPLCLTTAECRWSYISRERRHHYPCRFPFHRSCLPRRLQEVDQQSLFLPVTKKAWTVTHADRVPEMFRETFRVAISGFAENRSVPSDRICLT